MTVFTVHHTTTYRYRQPVRLGPHQLMFRPRDSFDQRLLDCQLKVAPEPVDIRWIHDVFGNCVTLVDFDSSCQVLEFETTICLDHSPGNAPDFRIEDYARFYPFSYAEEEVPDLAPYVRRMPARYASPAARAADLRSRRVAARGRLRLPALDDHPRADGRREPVHQPAADRARRDPLGDAPPARRASSSTAGTSPCSENARAGDLRVEARQLVEIARALSYGARFIILDEPTAQLDGDEIKRLFRRMRELQAAGVTFLFISHHLQEVYEICQAVTVLRDARHIVARPCRRSADAAADRGHDRRAGAAQRHRCGRPHASRERAGRARGEAIFPATTTTMSASRSAAARSSASPARPAAAASASRRRWPASARTRAAASAIDGEALPPGDVPAALALGVGCVPKSRHKQGLVLSQSVADNTTDDDRSHARAARLHRAAKKDACGPAHDRRARHRHRGPGQPVSASRAATSRRW